MALPDTTRVKTRIVVTSGWDLQRGQQRADARYAAESEVGEGASINVDR